MTRLIVLFVIAFVDTVGAAMIIPILPFYAVRYGASAFLVGLLVSAFSLAQLLSGPAWGRLSDRIGRRPVLLLSLGAGVVSYAVFALASMMEQGFRRVLIVKTTDRVPAGGHAQITGSFSMEEASDLAIVLRAGALPAPVKIIQNVTVGPSLGQDSIHKGLIAGLVGVVLVVLFMTFYYRLSGVVANFGMVINIVYLMGALAALGATLTLPGIAAIVLLIGMSVDSNVLIFERIREELRLGKTPKAALDSGYDKAFLTIMDSHVTTLITAAVLFQFGTGPIRGFAVTLVVGLVANVFASYFVSKFIFEWVLGKRHVESLSI